MKTLLRLFLAGCAFAGASAAFAANKAPTFKVVGYYERDQPKSELVAKAASEIGTKMKDFVAVKSEEEADQVVQVLFKQDGTYRIYWDALPLARSENRQRNFEKSAFDFWTFPAESKNGEAKSR